MIESNYNGQSISATKIERVRYVVQDELETDWRQKSKAKLNYLCKLPVGWDGFRAHPVSLYNALFALEVLNQLCLPDTPAPQIVPGVNGNCQLEWHTLAGDLELDIKAPNHVEAYYSVLTSNPPVEDEVTLRNDFTEIVKILRQITEPAIADAAAA